MTTVSEINELLKAASPFSKPPYVNDKDIWAGDNFPDLETLNAHASDTVMMALEAIKKGEYDTTSILIISDSSAGKSHLISRLRRKIKIQNYAFLLVVGYIENLNAPYKSLQSFLSSSLSHEASLPITQWQELATNICNKAWNKNISGVTLVNTINQQQNKVEELFKKTVSRYCNLITDVSDPDVVRAILWTLVKGEDSLAAMKWLAGKELAESKAKFLKLPQTNECLSTILEIFKVMSCHNELVLCFDELDNYDVNENGIHRASVVSGLIKDLFQNLHRGVIVTFMDEPNWKNRVKTQLPQANYQKVSTYGDPIRLKSLNEELCLSLLELYLERFYSHHNIIPPSPIYPFEEKDVRSIGRERPLVRKFLLWCKEWIINFNKQFGDEKSIDSVSSRSQEAFESELDVVTEQMMDDDSLIAVVLLNAFKSLVGYTIESVTIESVEEKVVNTAKGKKDPYINFKIVGSDRGKCTAIGVSVTQTNSGKTLAAYFKHLINPEKYNIELTRGCLVRSRQKTITSYNRKNYLIPFTEELGGEFVDLKLEEIKPLIALHRVYQKRESDYELMETEIKDFVAQKGAEFQLGEHNPLIKEILSDPSGQAPDLEDEPEVEVEENEPPASQEEDLDQVEEFFSN